MKKVSNKLRKNKILKKIKKIEKQSKNNRGCRPKNIYQYMYIQFIMRV